MGRIMVPAFLRVALLLASFLGISGWVRFTPRVSRWARLEELYKFCCMVLGHQQWVAHPCSLGLPGRCSDYCFSLNYVGTYESCGPSFSQSLQ